MRSKQQRVFLLTVGLLGACNFDFSPAVEVLDPPDAELAMPRALATQGDAGAMDGAASASCLLCYDCLFAPLRCPEAGPCPEAELCAKLLATCLPCFEGGIPDASEHPESNPILR